jgi:hypothetical protein
MSRVNAEPGSMKPSQYSHFAHKAQTLKIKAEELVAGMVHEGASTEVVEALRQAQLAVVHAQSVLRSALEARKSESQVEKEARRGQREEERQKRQAEAQARKAAKAASRAQSSKDSQPKKLEDVLIPAKNSAPIHLQDAPAPEQTGS